MLNRLLRLLRKIGGWTHTRPVPTTYHRSNLHGNILFALALGCIVATAEEQRPLQPINRAAFPEEKRCSDFFFTTTFGGAVAEQIIFAYQASDGSTKRDTIPRKRAVVQLSETLTYERITTEDGVGALFRVSNAEYAKARECLPEPKVR
jgi:hypothetical protein